MKTGVLCRFTKSDYDRPGGLTLPVFVKTENGWSNACKEDHSLLFETIQFGTLLLAIEVFGDKYYCLCLLARDGVAKHVAVPIRNLVKE